MGQGEGEGEDEPGKASEGAVRVCPSRSTSTQGTWACASGPWSPHRDPSAGLQQLPRASGEWACFWVGSCGFTETTDLFWARSWWSSLRAAELSPGKMVWQRTIESSRTRWNFDCHTESTTQ